MSEVRGIILAGMYPRGRSGLEHAFPRPLWPVANTPLIHHPLRWFHEAGIGKATICTNYSSRVIRRALAGGGANQVDLMYYEDWVPRGPAGCVRDAGWETDAETFVVVCGTIVPSVGLTELLAAHRCSGAGLTVVASKPASSDSDLDGQLSPLGVYVFSRRVLECIPKAGYHDIKEMLIPQLRRNGERVSVHVTREACAQVIGVDSYLATNEWLLDRIARNGCSSLGYRKVKHCLLHETARIEPTARLIGPVLAGPGTRIAAHAIVVGPTVLGTDNVISEQAVVCRSVLWDRCRVGRGGLLDRCIMTHDAWLGPASRRYDAVLGPGTRRRTALQNQPTAQPRTGPSAAQPLPATVDRSEAGAEAQSTDLNDAVMNPSLRSYPATEVK